MQTHIGARFYSRTIPKPCFANRPTIHPNRLALGCNGPRGEIVRRVPTATYRFRLAVGRPFVFEVMWQSHKPHVTTRQAGPWSYVTVWGPRRCAVLTQILRVTIVPR